MNSPTIEILQGCFKQLQNEDNTPRFLYHYTKFESAIRILASGRLFMRSLEKQNDPWEFLDREDTGIAVINQSIEESSENLRKHDHAIAERKNFVRQTSFSIDTERLHGWNLTRMWAQYADNHNGVCLIFDYKQLCDDFEAAFADKAPPPFHNPIDYVNLHKLDKLEEKYWEPNTTFLDEAHIELLFTKHNDFEHEQEYRFLAADCSLKNSNENLHFPIKNSFCGLITGKRFCLEDNRDVILLRMKHLRDAMNLCNRKSLLFNMDPDKFSEPLFIPEEEIP